jgi:hypothetical protein
VSPVQRDSSTATAGDDSELERLLGLCDQLYALARPQVEGRWSAWCRAGAGAYGATTVQDEENMPLIGCATWGGQPEGCVGMPTLNIDFQVCVCVLVNGECVA